MLFRSLAIAIVGLGVSVAAPTVASAYPAQTSGWLNVRGGPGVGYPKVATLPPGALVDVGYCQRGWCWISFGPGEGWASAAYLYRAGYYRPPPRPFGPQYFFGFQFGYPGPDDPVMDPGPMER